MKNNYGYIATICISSLRLQLVNAGNKVHASFKGGINRAVMINTEKTL